MKPLCNDLGQTPTWLRKCAASLRRQATTYAEVRADLETEALACEQEATRIEEAHANRPRCKTWFTPETSRAAIRRAIELHPRTSEWMAELGRRGAAKVSHEERVRRGLKAWKKRRKRADNAEFIAKWTAAGREAKKRKREEAKRST